MLILFDIDGTLLLTSGAGMRSMRDAGRRLYGPAFTTDGIAFAGNLDPLIWRQAAARNGLPDTDAEHARFRAAYAACLAEHLANGGTARALPGVLDLLARLRADAACTLGVLTGNYEETGRVKLAAAGIDPEQFAVRVWGDMGATRRDLPPVGMAAWAARRGAPADPREVLIVGDTPSDIDCAKAHGCRVLAVATGPAHTRDELAAHEPDHLRDDLADVDAVLAWMRVAPRR